MAGQSERHPMTMKRVLYEIAGMNDVPVRRDVEWQRGNGGSLTMDVYYPPLKESGPLPAIVFAVGYADDGFRRILGCRFKEMASTESWAQLFAMSGIVAIAYANREPVVDARALLEHVAANAGSLGIDARRIGVFATSGHGPLALSLLAIDQVTPLKSAILCYAYTMDSDGDTAVADAANKWGFVNAVAGKSVADLRRDVPMFIARAGGDEMPRLNDTLDRVVATALASNLPLTLVNEPSVPHAFDLVHDTHATRAIVRHILAFARSTLSHG